MLGVEDMGITGFGKDENPSGKDSDAWSAGLSHCFPKSHRIPGEFAWASHRLKILMFGPASCPRNCLNSLHIAPWHVIAAHIRRNPQLVEVRWSKLARLAFVRKPNQLARWEQSP